jgi:GNAT superfamily N-acetyltransferase
MPFQIRQLGPFDGAVLREVRIAALRDSPREFGETLAEALTRSEQAWSDQAPSVFIAQLDGQLVGMAFVFEDRADPEAARVGGMWVAPSVRRAGIGLALVETALSWAKANGKRCIRLWANQATPGQDLYRRAGFVPTGAQKPFPGDGSRTLVEMQLDLDDMG